MKKLYNIKWYIAQLLLLAFVAGTVVSCDDDDNDYIPLPESRQFVDGFFVYGAGCSAVEAGDPLGLMTNASLINPTTGDAIDANENIKIALVNCDEEASFNFAVVKDKKATTVYGIDGDKKYSKASEISTKDGQITSDSVLVASVKEGTDPIKITTKGMYAVILNMDESKLYAFKVDRVYPVGAGIADDIYKGTDEDFKVLSDTRNVKMLRDTVPVSVGEYKYSINDGSLFALSDVLAINLLSGKPTADANEEGDIDLFFGGYSLTKSEEANYEVVLTYDYENQKWIEMSTKTGKYQGPINYAVIKMEIYGNALDPSDTENVIADPNIEGGYKTRPIEMKANWAGPGWRITVDLLGGTTADPKWIKARILNGEAVGGLEEPWFYDASDVIFFISDPDLIEEGIDKRVNIKQSKKCDVSVGDIGMGTRTFNINESF
ncbi:MAG: hypothetical protein N4A49_05265 [Marinifilaceae bacterium]|jgi:hypothetical protein|nr:hypothetical protein [Marinifilaceae bacterium]